MAKENAKADGGDVACAQDLFHRHGIRGVGVETIAEAAGTNKMTLYRHFGSKDDLVSLRVSEPQEFKKRQRDRLARLCKAAGASQPGLLADTIVLLIEGARVSRRSVGTGGPSASLVRTREAVIASRGI